jgi:hypothetical protein
MKWLCTVLVALLWSVAAQAQSVFVHADRTLNKDLSAYKTYAWETALASNNSSGSPQDVSLGKSVRNAINDEMEGRGYKLVKSSPDLLINFQIFEEPTTMRGFTGYTVVQSKEVRQPEDTTSFKLQGGTLYVNLVDGKTGTEVWRGYTSGLLDKDTAAWREGKIDEAINLLFQEYKARADHYSSVSR